MKPSKREAALAELRRLAAAAGHSFNTWAGVMGYTSRQAFTHKLAGMRSWTPQDVLRFSTELNRLKITHGGLAGITRLAADANTKGGHNGSGDTNTNGTGND